MERDRGDRPFDYQRDDDYAHLLGVVLAPGSMPIPHRSPRRGGRPIAPPGQMVYYRRRRRTSQS